MEQKSTHRSHQSRRPKTIKPAKGFERLLNAKTFIALGAIFVLVGLYTSLSSSSGSNGLVNLIRSFFASGADVPIGPEIAGTGLTELILYFLPALILLIGSLIFARIQRKLTLVISILTAVYLVVIQIKISFWNVIYEGCFYPGFYTAILFLWLATLLLLANGLIHRKSILLTLNIIFFYISAELLYMNFFTHIEFFFGFIFFFSFLITWVSQQIKKPINHLINFIFAWGFLGLFWLRKFVVFPRPEFLPLFFIIGSLFYLLFYIVIVATSGKENPITRWIQFTLTGSNLLIILGTTLWVLHRFYAPAYQPLFIGALLLFNLLGLYLYKKFKLLVWELPYHYAVMFLAALVLPFCFQEARLLLFTSVLAVLMLGYAHKTKDVPAFWISLVSLVSTVGFFLYSWIRFCLPAHFFVLIVPEPDLIGYGLLIGGLAIVSLGFTTWQIQSLELSLSHKYFSKRKYDRLVRVMFLFSTFVTLGWLGFSLVSHLTGSLNYTPLPWFIAGCLLFIGVIRYYSGKQSSLKKPVLYLSALFILIYPFMVQWNMVLYRNSLLLKNDLNFIVVFLHYLAVVLVLILGRMTIKRMRRHHIKEVNLLHLVDLITVSFLIFLFWMEYDNLSAIFLGMQSSPGSQLMSGDPLLQNRYLPYSMILWIVATVVFIRAMIQRNHFMRNLGIVLFLGMLVKLFVIDFEGLSTVSRSIVYLLLGLYLMGFAYIFPRLQKGEPILPEFKRTGERE